MAQDIVHGYLYHSEGQLVKAGGHSKGGDSLHTGHPGNEILQLQMYGLIPRKIEEDHTGRKNLTDHGCPCSTGDPPAKGKDKQRVQHCVDQCAGDHGDHGICGTAVCPD